MKTVADYKAYVYSVLNDIPVNVPVKASYNTGFGLHLTDEDLGEEPMTLFVMQHSVTKVKPPEAGLKDWDKAWNTGKKIVNKWIKDRLDSEVKMKDYYGRELVDLSTAETFEQHLQNLTELVSHLKALNNSELDKSLNKIEEAIQEMDQIPKDHAYWRDFK